MVDTTLTDLTFTNTHYFAKIYELDTQGIINQGSDMAANDFMDKVINKTAAKKVNLRVRWFAFPDMKIEA